MRLGFHVRVARGYEEAIAYAQRVGCTAVQFFSGNPKTYRVALMDRPALRKFRELRKAAGIEPAAIHTSYLINLASEDARAAKNSLALLKNDLAIAAEGEVAYVNTHLGSYGSGDRSAGFARVIAALESALATISPSVLLVLENSAGAGSLCGGTIEELGEILRVIDHSQLAVCLDTAHSWAAGYAIDSQDGVSRFLDLVDEHVGLRRVPMLHFNDTQIPLGGHRDRHHHIGEGNIGFAGFRALLGDPRLRGKTAILETPGEEADDIRNMQTVRAIMAGVG
ncbi:MAG: deoxyribonuclease IV [Candidatus Eremiobacteraeota bacterium]|nr:deoxyribonuclease IV [Candidatus Eremiobacteraeota bacterium]MBV8354637.1 deoxyribonuclease IV [Candidatus Eremiobacteraeota bacterium]